MRGKRTSRNFDVLLRSGRMLGKLYAPAVANLRKLDVEARPLASAVHIPAVDAVAFNSEELHEAHINIRADAVVNGFRYVERAKAMPCCHHVRISRAPDVRKGWKADIRC